MGKLEEMDKDLIIEKYKEFGSLTELAKLFSVSLETIRKYFIKNDIPYTKSVVYKVNHDFFSKDNEESFYWAGFIAADGCIEKTKPRIVICLKDTDCKHLDKFRNSVETDAPLVFTTRTDKRKGFKSGKYYSCRIRITSKKMVNDLKRFNITSCKSKTFEFPKHLLNNKYIKHFIRGLIDGDGGIYYNKKHPYIFLCGTKDCVESVASYFNKHVENKITIRKNKNLYSFCIGHIKSIKNILNDIYDCSVYLNRKKEKVDKILKHKDMYLEIDRQKLLDLYKKYKNIKKVAKELGCSFCTVNRRIIKFKIREELGL